MKKSLINIHIITTNNINGAMFIENNSINLFKTSTYIKLARQSGHVALINNGPFLTGAKQSEYYAALTAYKRIPLITMMNLLKYDATNISYHDFQLGLNYFSKAHAMSDFPFLSSNIICESTKEPYFNTPYIIKQFDGIKIGIIAFSECVNYKYEQLSIIDPKQSIKSWIRYMYDKESPDYVIALHSGNISDICIQRNDAYTLCTEGVHTIITNSDEEVNINHDFIEIVNVCSNNDKLLHLKLSFKERTSSFELKGREYTFIDVSRYAEDINLKEMFYYEEKEYNNYIQ